MLTRIAAFEARYQLRAPLFAIGAAIFFLLTFGSVTVDEIQIGGKGNVNVNSPFAIVQTVGVMSVFAVFIATGFVANVVVRDDETGFAPIIRATRITKRAYLFGRFIGAFGVAALVLLSVPLGMLVGSWMPWLDQEKVGPFAASHYLFAYFAIGLPSLFVMAASFFALATATRSMLWTYVGVVAFITLFVTSRALLRDPAYDTISALSDPFGMSALSHATRYWTASERNTSLPPWNALLLQSRLLWLAFALGALGLAYWRFRFAEPSGRGPASGPSAPVSRTAAASLTTLHAAGARSSAGWRQLATVTRFDLGFVFKSPAFFVLLAIGVLNALGGLQQVASVRGIDYLPVTRAVVNMLNGAFTLIAVIIAVYYAGELVWRDHDRRMHEIIGVTPAADWMFVVPKVLAITLVLASSYVAAAGMGVAFQTYHGYMRYELGHYLLWFILPGTIDALLTAILAVFVQVIVPHKFLGWIVMLLYLVASIALATSGFEHNLYNYGGAPNVPLSDMNGLGHFWVAHSWFQAYWLAFGGVLLVLSHALWRRGTEPQLTPRVRRLKQRLAGPAGWLLTLSAVTWVWIGVHNYYNTNILNHYLTRPDLERMQADYEKTLLAYESVPQPRVVDVELNVDVYPRQVKAITRGEYLLENRTATALTAVHVRWDLPRLEMNTLSIEGARLTKDYPEYHYQIYTFEPPLKPEEQRRLRFTTTLQEQGFPNSRPLERIVENGSFLDSFEIAPRIGIDRSVALTDRAKRRKYGLPPDVRPPKLEDAAASAYHYLRHDSDWVTAEISLTTDADQTPVAPGYTLSDSVEAGRRTLRTRTEAPIMHFFSLQSARYAQQQKTWRSARGDEVALTVYYHPEHAYNVPRMLDAMTRSLDIFTRSFSPYQFRQARILEFPAYAEFAQSFANTIPYSESIGFIQHHPADPALADERIDLVTYVTAHEMAHQWWAHQVIGADKQGATMLSESFAQYSAMLVMEQKYGPQMVRKFLKYELDSYLRSRGSEVVEELPLVRVENQGYIHYRKGTLVMYWLKECVGQEVVDRALQRLLEAYAFRPAPYPASSDFVRYLRQEAGPQWDALITDLFENITLYDLKARDVTAKKRADGSYEVRFTIDAKKLYADGKGRETEAPLAEELEVGVFSAQPGKKGFSKQHVLLLERRALVSGAQTLTYVVPSEPKWVGVDPYNKRIDRNSDDNLVAVDGA
jgi:ABC-2 type transport system permease protein